MANKYTLITNSPIRWVDYCEKRMEQVAEDIGAVMVYSDFFDPQPHPLIDYQKGALRDDFDFGAAVLVRGDYPSRMSYTDFYALRLRLSREGKIVHLPEFLYYADRQAVESEQAQFAYVDKANRQTQIRLEEICTEHLKAIGAYLPPFQYLPLPAGETTNGITASVIIPCRNRVKTIRDAVLSALSQTVKEPYTYNVIVVDDNSTDGTKAVLREIAEQEEKSGARGKLILINQNESWHAIGGNWNAALHHPLCGKYAIQLDSDDTYYDETTVQQFIDCFEKEHCAMVVGAYQLTDMAGHPLPPGKIDHAEWTEANGRNNALRINGLGAPRGFLTGLIKEMTFPTTKYGEDYAVGLRLTRHYRLGRIWNVVYNCRRWEENSDHALPLEALNRNNYYKDWIRTVELEARINDNIK